MPCTEILRWSLHLKRVYIESTRPIKRNWWRKRKKITAKTQTDKERKNINRHTVTGKRGKENNHRNSARKSLQFNRLTECFISSHAHNSNVCILYCFLAHFRVSIRSNEHLLLFQCCLPLRVPFSFCTVSVAIWSFKIQFSPHPRVISLVGKTITNFKCEASVSIFILYANCYCCFLIKIYDIKSLLFKIFIRISCCFRWNKIIISFGYAVASMYKDRTRAAQMLNVVWLKTKRSISRNNTR